MINGTTAVAAAETPHRNENKIIIQTWRIFLSAVSCIGIPLAFLRGHRAALSEAMLPEALSLPAKVTAGL